MFVVDESLVLRRLHLCGVVNETLVLRRLHVFVVNETLVLRRLNLCGVVDESLVLLKPRLLRIVLPLVCISLDVRCSRCSYCCSHIAPIIFL